MLNLDCAAAAPQAPATLDAVVAHLHRENERGAYVAQAEAEPVIAGLRRDLGLLLGVPEDGVALVENATTALDLLVESWPLTPGSRVAVAPSEWGPNRETFARAGAELVELATLPTGVIDLVALTTLLDQRPPDVVHVTQLASHRGLAQPVQEILRRCRDAGVPLWVDAAQSLGHVPADGGADATYAPGRKWLAGPRGVGVLAVAEQHWHRLRARRRAKHPPGLSAVRTLEPEDTSVAGRIGLAAAVSTVLATGVADRAERLGRAGRRTRAAVADLAGWAPLGDLHVGATTSLRPLRGQDVVEVRERLLEQHAVLTTAVLPWRAPGELVEGVLRISPGADVTDAELERFAAALGDAGHPAG